MMGTLVLSSVEVEPVIKMGIDTQGMKIEDQLPKNMTGHIVVFKDPLIVQTFRTVKMSGNMIPDDKGQMTETTVKELSEEVPIHFMRAEGGFGSYSECSGRMIVGKFFKTFQDVLDNEPMQSGNTKCYPDGYLPELFRKRDKEKL